MQKTRVLLRSFLVGVGIGTIIEGIISLIVGQMVVGVPSFVASHDPVFVKLIQIILYGGFGIVSNLAGTVYERPNGNRLANTIIHILIIFAYFSIVGFYLHWIDAVLSYIVSAVGFIIIYAIIWCVIYYSEKQRINAINAKLKERQGKN